MFPEKPDQNAQIMTLEALIASLLIIGSVLFVVSQVPSEVPRANGYSSMQLEHYGKDIITMLDESPSPDEDYDSLLQYYVSREKYDELDEFVELNLPQNVEYNLMLHSGEKSKTIVQNGYPRGDAISVKKLIATKNSSFGGIGIPRLAVRTEEFGNGSLIIPMDDKQNNHITAYNLVLKIVNTGIPVYQLLQDPRGQAYGYDWKWNISTIDDPWGGAGNVTERDYAGGPYVIKGSDLTFALRTQIQYWANNPTKVPSSKINRIEFDKSMINKLIIIQFKLSDGSVRTIQLLTANTSVSLTSNSHTGGDSELMEINTENLGYEDDDITTRIVGIVLINRGFHDLTVSNITVQWIPWAGEKLRRIRIDYHDYNPINDGSPPSTVNTGHTIIFSDPEKKVTVHESRQDFSYKYVNSIMSVPRIAVYSDLGTFSSYYSDSGLDYKVISNSDVLNGGLENFDIFTLPHESIDEGDMPDTVVEKIIQWVSNGGVLYAECSSIDNTGSNNGIDDRVEDVDGAVHPWYGFIGVVQSNNKNNIQFIGKTNFSGIGDTTGGYNDTANPGAPFNPLAQVYTLDGIIPGNGGRTSAFKLLSNYNPEVNILAVPLSSSSGTPDYPLITFAEAPFDKGRVIYFAGHDQSRSGQQRERGIFQSIMYPGTVKVYDHGISEIQILMWYK